MSYAKVVGKYVANRGVERNKRPLQNKCYKVEVYKTLQPTTDYSKYEKYKFKEEGYLSLSWCYERDFNKHPMWSWHGFVTPDELKERLGAKQWAKFCQGKRIFIVQRRIDGKNVPKKKKEKPVK